MMDELEIIVDDYTIIDNTAAIKELQERVEKLEAFVENAMSNPMIASMLD